MTSHTMNTHVGTLLGVGLGPGDPQLMTLAAVDAIRAADVLVVHAGPHGHSAALDIAREHISPHQRIEQLTYPVTTGATDHPQGYSGALAEFYLSARDQLAAHLDAGRTVAVLVLGDPLLYSSYQHLHRLLADDYPARIIPGITSPSGACATIQQPLAENTDIVTIIPATASRERLENALAVCDTAVIMKVGRNFPTVVQALRSTGKLDRAHLVVRATMDGAHFCPVTDIPENTTDIPYFSLVIVPHADTTAVHTEKEHEQGSVTVVGLGPGDPAWTTPETCRALADATDLVGYSTYINRVPVRSEQRRHLSDNKVEAERAAMALDLALRGRRVVVVSSGDPGIFAMAAAVLEVARDPQWRSVPVHVLPGMTAAHAVASRVGAPLGHDFGMISLSNRLKPWHIIERRIRALASADMAFAVYNPASRTRREEIRKLRTIVLEYQKPDTPVIVARAVGSAEEKICVTTLAAFDPDVVDMRTLLIVGASTTVAYHGPEGKMRVYTARHYD